LIVPPLERLPSKSVVSSLRKAQVSGSVDIRGEIRSSLLQDLTAYKRAVEAFQEDAGRCPTIEEGLKALRTDPGVEGWDGPYVSEEVQPMDPWDQPYRYRLLGSGESVKPVVYSTGQNEIDEYGLGDDVR
jgi:type II secretory pathway pseudopilin PulG